MKYLYKNGKTYLYKRRLPHSDKFYTFNTKTGNAKKAHRVSIIFNKLSYNLFEYIKRQGNSMAIDYTELFSILDDYKGKALDEINKNYETLRHQHLSDLFKIKVDDPILGTVQLDGASPKVIEPAIKTFETLSHCDMLSYKKQLLSIGKQIVKRGTPELKQLFQKYRGNEIDLLSFIQTLIKTESQILQVDFDRAVNRFGLGAKQTAPVQPMYSEPQYSPPPSTSYVETQKSHYRPLEELLDDFLFSINQCNFERKDLEKSRSQCYRTDKAIRILIDYLYDINSKATSGDITFDKVSEVYSLIPLIPKKQGSTNRSYGFYGYYKHLKGTDYQKRAIKTIDLDLQNYHRFVKYLTEQNYLTAGELKELNKLYKNLNINLQSQVQKGELKGEDDVEPLKDEMLKCFFNPNHNPYKTPMDILSGKKKLRKDQDINKLWARYFVPMIMLFTGARPSELSTLKTDDFEIRTFEDGKERILVYLTIQLKTFQSKRILIINDFLANELGLKKFIKKAQDENREFLFNIPKNLAGTVGKEFNRDKTQCIEPFLIKDDKFISAKYVMYSLRHNYKTYMSFKKGYDQALVHKIMGHKDEKISSNYISTHSKQIIEYVNDFDLYKIIDWTEFKNIAKII